MTQLRPKCRRSITYAHPAQRGCPVSGDRWPAGDARPERHRRGGVSLQGRQRVPLTGACIAAKADRLGTFSSPGLSHHRLQTDQRGTACASMILTVACASSIRLYHRSDNPGLEQLCSRQLWQRSRSPVGAPEGHTLPNSSPSYQQDAGAQASSCRGTERVLEVLTARRHRHCAAAGQLGRCRVEPARRRRHCTAAGQLGCSRVQALLCCTKLAGGCTVPALTRMKLLETCRLVEPLLCSTQAGGRLHIAYAPCA